MPAEPTASPSSTIGPKRTRSPRQRPAEPDPRKLALPRWCERSTAPGSTTFSALHILAVECPSVCRADHVVTLSTVGGDVQL